MKQQTPSGRPEGNSSTLADLLRSKREALGLNRTEMARLLAISRTQYTRLESGEQKHASPALLGRMVQRLDFKADYLYILTGYMPATLPSFVAYVRAMYPEWPDAAVAMLDDIHELLKYKYSPS